MHGPAEQEIRSSKNICCTDGIAASLLYYVSYAIEMNACVNVVTSNDSTATGYRFTNPFRAPRFPSFSHSETVDLEVLDPSLFSRGRSSK
jgi:hypothetical protein